MVTNIAKDPLKSKKSKEIKDLQKKAVKAEWAYPKDAPVLCDFVTLVRTNDLMVKGLAKA